MIRGEHRYDKLYRNNWRRDPVSGDNSNKLILTLHIFRGNKQINYRQARQLSNLLVCWQGRKSAYYPTVTIYIYIHMHNFVLLIPLKVVHLLGPSCQTASHPHSLPWFALEVWGGQLGLVLQCAVALPDAVRISRGVPGLQGPLLGKTETEVGNMMVPWNLI